MTIKEAEALVGITRANIRFYEKEGLLAPGRSVNNYREYSLPDVERLKKIKVLRTMGIPVAEILDFMEGRDSLEALLDRRAEDISRELEELGRVRDLCCEISGRRWEFETMDADLLDMKLEEMKLKGDGFMKKDRISRLCRARDLAFLFCFVCILSIAAMAVNQLLGIQVPETAFKVWWTIVALSPFPGMILSAAAAGKAQWEIPDMNRILADSGKKGTRIKKERDSACEAAWRFNQVCLCSLLFLPLNRMLDIRIPEWVQIIWAAVAVGSAVVLIVLRNRTVKNHKKCSDRTGSY